MVLSREAQPSWDIFLVFPLPSQSQKDSDKYHYPANKMQPVASPYRQEA